MQKHSEIANAYRNGISKARYWEYYYEDSMNPKARLPRLAALIYNNVFHNGKTTPDLRRDYHLAQTSPIC
jgi:citrate synthase